MAESKNVWERRRDRAAQAITKLKEATDTAFGVGERPYGTRKLSGAEKRQYFQSLDPLKQQELLGQMEDAERAEVTGG